MSKRKKYFAWILFPLSLIYRFVVGFRNLLFDWKILKSHEFDTPIISIGNISVGGTGKTPHVEYLISLLDSKYKLATLSRGYKRKTKGFLIANPESTVKEIGDEPKQIKRKFQDVTVAVDANRVQGVNKLLSEDSDLDVILLDDAFQHRYIDPGLSILLIDYNRPIDKDHFLPYGNLREHPVEKRRAHIILMTKTPRNIKPIEQRIISKNLDLFPYQNLYFTTIAYGSLTPVDESNEMPLTVNDLKRENYGVVLVSGIANPDLLTGHIKEVADLKARFIFPDHHQYSEKDLRKITKKFNEIDSKNKVIITTEKDAVRLMEKDIEPAIKKNLYYLPMKIEFINGNKDEFEEHIFKFIKKLIHKNPAPIGL